MDTKKFFTGRAIGFSILLIIGGLIAGFYALNSYIYKEKQGDGVIPKDIVETEPGVGTPFFTWRYEKAETLNPDGNPNTEVFLEASYPNGVIKSKLIDTTPGSCNDLPDKEIDSFVNSTNIQCYYAGLGYRFKIVSGTNSYLVMRKTFEEAMPDYNPPVYEYEIVGEFIFSK